jgi:hypothetical protein
VLLPYAIGAGTGKGKISAVFMFGDSMVDPGNNNNRITEAKADFPPYGQDFPGGKATGRFSNGKVPGDMLGTCMLCISFLFFSEKKNPLHRKLNFISKFIIHASFKVANKSSNQRKNSYAFCNLLGCSQPHDYR